MNEKRHATRVRKTLSGEVVEYTNHRDEDGVIVDLTIDDVERMSVEAIDAYQERRGAQLKELEDKKEEEQRFEDYKERFVQAGGNKSDAAAAYKAMRNEQAATAARQADNEALYHARRNIRSKV